MDQNGQGMGVNKSSGGSVDGFVQQRPTNTGVDLRPTMPLKSNVSKLQQGQQLLSNQTVNKPRLHGAKVAVIMLSVLLIGALAGGGYLYLKYSGLQKDYSTAKDKTNNLQKQLDTVTGSANAAATESAAALDSQIKYASDLNVIANQLKTTCGKACVNVNIPTLPTNAAE